MERKLITYVYNEELKTYEVLRGEQVLKDYQEFIDKEGCLNLVMTNDDDRKAVYNARTAFNKELKALMDDKKNVQKVILGTFNNCLDTAISMVKDTIKKQEAMLDEYDGVETFTISTITLHDKALYEEIMAYLIEKGVKKPKKEEQE